MPAGDGVSLPTTLSQLGNVAKTQAKGQQAPTPAAPFSEQMNRDDELRVNRVKQADETQQEKIDPKQENADKRKRRRLKRQRKQLGEESGSDSEAAGPDPDQEDNERLGVLIDLRV